MHHVSAFAAVGNQHNWNAVRTHDTPNCYHTKARTHAGTQIHHWVCTRIVSALAEVWSTIVFKNHSTVIRASQEMRTESGSTRKEKRSFESLWQISARRIYWILNTEYQPQLGSLFNSLFTSRRGRNTTVWLQFIIRLSRCHSTAFRYDCVNRKCGSSRSRRGVFGGRGGREGASRQCRARDGDSSIGWGRPKRGGRRSRLPALRIKCPRELEVDRVGIRGGQYTPSDGHVLVCVFIARNGSGGERNGKTPRLTAWGCNLSSWARGWWRWSTVPFDFHIAFDLMRRSTGIWWCG